MVKNAEKKGIEFEVGQLKPKNEKCNCGSEYKYELILIRTCEHALVSNDTIKCSGSGDPEMLRAVTLRKGERYINNIGVR